MKLKQTEPGVYSEEQTGHQIQVEYHINLIAFVWVNANGKREAYEKVKEYIKQGKIKTKVNTKTLNCGRCRSKTN